VDYIRRICATVQELKADLLKDIDRANNRASDADSEAVGLKMKLAAAKSVVALTKSNLDESSSQASEMREALRRAKADIQRLEQSNTALHEKMAALASELKMEVQMKVLLEHGLLNPKP